MHLRFSYDANLFEDETINNFAEYFIILANEIIRDPNKPLGEYEFFNVKDALKHFWIDANLS